MTNPNLPTPSPGPSGELYSPASLSGGDNIPQYPALFLDSGAGARSVRPGSFVYLGVPISDVHLVFISSIQFRRYFDGPYRSGVPAKDQPPLTCSSWNGRDAYGHGGTSKEGPIAERDCDDCPHSEYRREDRTWWCPPSGLFFGMLVHRESDVWLPYFLEATGMMASPTGKAYKAAQNASSVSWKRGADGNPAPSKPIYCNSFKPSMRKNPTANGYLIDWGTMSPVPDVDAQWISTFLRSHGEAIWTKELERRKEKAHRLGAPTEEAGAASTDYGEVPF